MVSRGASYPLQSEEAEMKDGFELQLHIRTEGWWLPASELERSPHVSAVIGSRSGEGGLGLPSLNMLTVSRLVLRTFSSSLSVHL